MICHTVVWEHSPGRAARTCAQEPGMETFRAECPLLGARRTRRVRACLSCTASSCVNTSRARSAGCIGRDLRDPLIAQETRLNVPTDPLLHFSSNLTGPWAGATSRHPARGIRPLPSGSCIFPASQPGPAHCHMSWERSKGN